MEPEGPVVYYEDNQSTIRVVEEERDTARLKHIDVRHRFIREEIQRGRVTVRYVPTGEQDADMMTKGLSSGVFQTSSQTGVDTFRILSGGVRIGNILHFDPLTRLHKPDFKLTEVCVRAVHCR